MANDLTPPRLDTAFVPAFPPRPVAPLPLFALWRTARRNAVAIWPRQAFAQEVLHRRLLGRELLVCNSPETIHYAFVERHENFQRRCTAHRRAAGPLLGEGLLISDGVLWRERRRVVAPLTHATRLPELAPLATEAAATRREAWRRRIAGLPIDMLAEMQELASELVCRAVFGRRLADGLAGPVARALAAWQRRGAAAEWRTLLGVPDWWPWPSLRPAPAALAPLHGLIDARIASLLDDGPDEPSLIRDMAMTRVPEADHRMGRRAFRDEAITLLLAGQPTLALLLAWALCLLAQDRVSAARLREEAEVVLGGRVATLDDVPVLPFAQAVLEETLRLCPPVPLLAREALGPDRIGGRSLPRGSLVLASPWLLHRKPDLWDEPDAFLPERFLPDAPRPPRYAYIPFGVGPRLCTGQPFGLAAAVICLATLAGSFALRLEPEAEVMPVARPLLWPGARLPMRLRPRGR